MFVMFPTDNQIEEEAHDEVFANYRNQMYYVAVSILKSDHDAEDAVQDAILAITKQPEAIPDDPKLLRAYVLTATRNAALNIQGRNSDLELESISNIDDYRLSYDDRLFERVTASLDYNTLIRAMEKLPLRYREVLMLRYVNEMKYREIAELLGRKQSTVHQQITRGRKMLVKLCKKEGMSFDE